MTRHIRVKDTDCGLNARMLLLDDMAPRWAEALWQIAGAGGMHDAIHAIWTGPEISCPIPEADLPESARLSGVPLENATSYPEEGEIAVVYAAAHAWKGQPPFAFFDVGLFYGRGARLLMPMGWIQACVCARVVKEDVVSFQAACQAMRKRGACRLSFHQET